MKTGNAFLLEQKDIARAAAGQLISGRSAGKPSADNDVIVKFHNLYITTTLHHYYMKNKNFPKLRASRR